ncbi:hypothetical protein EJ08DRAFT_684027 [Tothia fuscella]|uniref:Uncharacterized protein n=1 Tax=Tothia fuscella TaxID=1048955 RepID=A0A9P4NEJ3_9PEZI|nr:hypothetical protein EJ08DRAFT_684027 [Tothia fuscella]
MAPQQSRTFLPYSDGIEPEALRIGGLYLNPLDPHIGLESQRFEYREDLGPDEYESNIRKYAWKERRDDRGFSLDFELSNSNSMGVNFSEWLKFNGEHNKTSKATLVGKSGRRLQIRKPEKFLKDEVIKQNEVQEWIRTHASICFKGKFGHHKWKCPEIWMCTGVQLVTGGDVQTGNSKGSKIGGGAGGDPGPLVGAPPGVLKVGVEGSHENSETIGTDFGYDDERVWAAQFMEISIEYGNEEDPALTEKEKRSLPRTILNLNLQQIEDLAARGIRSGVKEDQKASTTPCLVGRVTVKETLDDDDEGEEACPDLVVSDIPYVMAAHDVHWDMYKECSMYLDVAAARKRSQSPGPATVGAERG